jgi:hypothetical protein
VELVAAFAFGVLAAAAWAAFALRRRPPPGSARLQIGLAVAVAAWLLPGVYLWSTVNLLHPRYLESITPAIAAAAGIGLASLVRLASLRVAGVACLAAGLALTTLVALQRAALGGLGTVVVAAAALAVVAAALSRAGIRVLVPVACALAIVAVLVPPLHNSLARVRGHSTDSGFPGSMSPKTTARLSRYLRAHQDGRRYELAASSWNTALPIIVRDARPVLALTSVLQRPVVSVGKLRALVKAGEVRYVMIAGGCGTAVPSHLSRCPATVAWARRHSVDVTRKAGINQKGLLWRLRSRAAVERRSSIRRHSRSRATRAAHRRARGG